MRPISSLHPDWWDSSEWSGSNITIWRFAWIQTISCWNWAGTTLYRNLHRNQDQVLANKLFGWTPVIPCLDAALMGIYDSQYSQLYWIRNRFCWPWSHVTIGNHVSAKGFFRIFLGYFLGYFCGIFRVFLRFVRRILGIFLRYFLGIFEYFWDIFVVFSGYSWGILGVFFGIF